MAGLSKEDLVGTIVLVLTDGVYLTANILHIPEGSREILGLNNSGLRLGTYSAGILMICTADLPLVSGLYEWDGAKWAWAPDAVTDLIQRSRAHSAPTPPGQLRPDGNLAIGPEVPIGNTGLVMQEIVPPGVDPTALSEADEEARMEAQAAARDDVELAPEIRQQLDTALRYPTDDDQISLDGVVYFWNSFAGMWFEQDGEYFVNKQTMREYGKQLRVLPFKLVERPEF